jgi:exosome complex component RRP43
MSSAVAAAGGGPGGGAPGATAQVAAAATAAAGAGGAQPHQQQLQADAFKRLYPEQFFARFVAEGLRPDGRGLRTPRPVAVGLHSVGAADGSALVKIGATTVLAGARLEVAVPPDDAPDRGQVVVAAELTPLCSGEWRPGRPAPEAHTLAARVSELLLSTGVLDARQLVISPGAAIWVLYLDLYVVDAAGGLLDAALLAAVAALRDARLPAVHLTPEGNVERGLGPENDGGGGGGGGGGRPLELAGAPVCLTCGVYKEHIVVDPDHEEEALMGARVSVVIDGSGGLLGERAGPGRTRPGRAAGGGRGAGREPGARRCRHAHRAARGIGALRPPRVGPGGAVRAAERLRGAAASWGPPRARPATPPPPPCTSIPRLPQASTSRAARRRWRPRH